MRKENEIVKRESVQKYIGMQVGHCPYCDGRSQLVLRFGYYTEPQGVHAEHTDWQEVQAYMQCPKCKARGPVKYRKDFREWEMGKNPLGEFAAYAWRCVGYSKGRAVFSLEQSDIIIEE